MPVRERFTEQVSIDVGGEWVAIPARELRITESRTNRIIGFDFSVLNDGSVDPAAWSAMTIGARILIYQQVGSREDAFIGYITRRPRRIVGASAQDRSISGHDETTIASRYRFIHAWPSQTARTVSEIITEAWTKYGPAGLDLSGIQQNNSNVGPITSSLGTLFEFMEQLAKRTGWDWRIRLGQVQFWDPTTTIFQESLVEGDNIVADSLTIDEELPKVANVVSVPAKVRLTDFPDVQETRAGQAQYFLQYHPLSRQFIANGETVYLDQPPTVLLNEIEQTVAEDGGVDADSVACVYHVENRFIRFNIGAVPAVDGLELKVIYSAEIPVIVRRRNTDSIGVFGEIHERVVRTPRPTRQEAESIADAFLRERSFPTRPITLETTAWGLRPGMFVPVVLPSEEINELMPVVEVTRSSRPGNLDITVVLNQLPASDEDLIFDLWQRLSRLESAEVSREQRIEQYSDWNEEWTWEALWTTALNACSYPSDTLYPDEELYPC